MFYCTTAWSLLDLRSRSFVDVHRAFRAEPPHKMASLMRMRTVARPAARKFSTSVVATPAGTVAVVPGNTSSPMVALATMPLTIASNNMALGLGLARWGVAGGLFLYALIRPSEWDRVRTAFRPVSPAPPRARATRRPLFGKEGGWPSRRRPPFFLPLSFA